MRRLCSSHAIINELFAEGPREPGSWITYPLTKGNTLGYTVYSLIGEGADPLARKLAPFLPGVPTQLADASRTLTPEVHGAIETGLFYDPQMEEGCASLGCGVPATFDVWEFTIDREGETHLCERNGEQLCLRHAENVERVRGLTGEYHIAVPKGGILLYKPIIPGELRLPESLRGLVHDFTELTPELERTFAGLLRAKLVA